MITGNILFYDTETTGKADMKGSPTDTGQPYLVQLGAVMLDYNGNIHAQVDLTVKPDGWIIPPEATDIHGISHELAEKTGVPLRTVMSVFSNLCKQSTIISAHNLDFDELIALIQYHKLGVSHSMDHLQKVCTMKYATDQIKIPSPYRKGQFKWPSLEEASKFYLGKSVSGAHKAMNDCIALVNIFAEMKKRGHLPGVNFV